MSQLRYWILVVLGQFVLFLAACSAPPTATLSPTDTPSPLPATPTATVTSTPSPPPTFTPSPLPAFTPTPSFTPTPTPTPTPGPFVYGRSAGGRRLTAWQFGHGATAVALVGGVHGGLEWNTTELVEALRDRLLADSSLLPDGVRLLLVPLANPDGAAAGVGLAGRVNAHGVDLARDWSAVVRWGERPFAPDFAPAPQPENVALHDLLLGGGVRAAVFYHSFDALCLHGRLFPGPGPTSASLAQTMAEATGYPVSPPGTSYSTRGQPAEWLAAQGIAAVDVHLPDRFELDRETNLIALAALLQWAAAPGIVTPSVATSPPPTRTLAPTWTAPSPLYGELAAGYPLAVEGERFTLHYQPGAPADGDTDYLVEAVERAQARVNRMLTVNPAWRFDLYVAGTPFTYPGETSRGYSMSAARQVFIRYDGTGPLTEFESVLTHELTHLTALNEFGYASSPMISEGLAVYIQWPVFEAAGWLPFDQVCAAMQSVGALPSTLYLVGDEASYNGYVDQDNYVASGCFVAFLVERWGMGAVAQLYHPADWEGVTGLTLAGLDTLWAGARAARAAEVTVDAAALVELLDEMGRAYAYQAAHREAVQGQAAEWALDGLRVTWRMGRFDKARAYADEFHALGSSE
jgi:predicted deacylase